MNVLNVERLIEAAFLAKKQSYAPYSNYHVGAALFASDGEIYGGCNIENAAYSPTNCAERTAFFKAVSEGKREFAAIAIVGDNGQRPAPCGVCRQVMSEFCDAGQFKIILARSKTEYEIYTLEELLPQSFSMKQF